VPDSGPGQRHAPHRPAPLAGTGDSRVGLCPGDEMIFVVIPISREGQGSGQRLPTDRRFQTERELTQNRFDLGRDLAQRPIGALWVNIGATQEVVMTSCLTSIDIGYVEGRLHVDKLP